MKPIKQRLDHSWAVFRANHYTLNLAYVFLPFDKIVLRSHIVMHDQFAKAVITK